MQRLNSMTNIHKSSIPQGGHKVDEIINNLKNEARALREVYATNCDNDLAKAIISIIDAINILERKAYGQAMTTEFDLK
jgi:hypothetical protein